MLYDSGDLISGEQVFIDEFIWQIGVFRCYVGCLVKLLMDVEDLLQDILLCCWWVWLWFELGINFVGWVWMIMCNVFFFLLCCGWYEVDFVDDVIECL